MDSKNIGSFISEIRKDMGLTQIALAEKLNVSNRAVSKWENGDGFPDVTILPTLAQVLGVTVDELLAGKKTEVVEKAEPFYINEANTTFNDMKKSFKAFYYSRTPKIFVISTCILFVIMFITCLILFFLDNKGMIALLPVILAVFVIQLIAKSLLSHIQAKTYIHDRKSMGDETLFTKTEFADKVYITTNHSTEIIEYSSITAVLETKELYVIKLGKGHLFNVIKDSFTKGSAEEFFEYIKTKVKPTRQDKFYKTFAIITTVMMISLSVVLVPLDIILLVTMPSEIADTEPTKAEIISERAEYFYSNKAEFEKSIERMESNNKFMNEYKKHKISSASGYEMISLNDISYIEKGEGYITFDYITGCDYISGYAYFEGDKLPYPSQIGYDLSVIDNEEFTYNEEEDYYLIGKRNSTEQSWYLVKKLGNNWFYFEYY